jgi:hypothetical protein
MRLIHMRQMALKVTATRQTLTVTMIHSHSWHHMQQQLQGPQGANDTRVLLPLLLPQLLQHRAGARLLRKQPCQHGGLLLLLLHVAMHQNITGLLPPLQTLLLFSPVKQQRQQVGLDQQLQ